MNDKIKWLIISVLLVGLIAGATVLYNSLGEQNGGGGLIIDMPSQNTEDSSENATDAIGTQATDTTENASDLPTTAPEESTSNTADVTTEKPEEPQEPENPAPDFTMVDMNGKEVKLSELRGKPVILNFWASWCKYCVQEMPDFEQFYKIYGNDIHFVMLNTLSSGETKSSGKKFISDKGYTFPVYFDESGIASQMYGAYSGIPITYFIDANGNLVAHCPGMLTADILKQGIGMIS